MATWSASSEQEPSNMRKFADYDHPAHALSMIRAFALHSYILKYPLILLADSEGPNLTARMCRLIWAFFVRICPNTFSHGAGHLAISFETDFKQFKRCVLDNYGFKYLSYIALTSYFIRSTKLTTRRHTNIYGNKHEYLWIDKMVVVPCNIYVYYTPL